MQISDLITFLIGLIGFALVTYGLWLISQPVAYIVSGFILLVWSWFVSKSKAVAAAPNAKEGS